MTDNKLVLPCDVGEVSDGYHTFNELYDHRCLLFLALAANLSDAWMSKKHEDGSEWEGWFIVGINLYQGAITYHLPTKFWDLARKAGIEILVKAPKWDGHNSQDVLDRLTKYLKAFDSFNQVESD